MGGENGAIEHDRISFSFSDILTANDSAEELSAICGAERLEGLCKKYIPRRNLYVDISGNQVDSCPGNSGLPGKSHCGSSDCGKKSHRRPALYRAGGCALGSQHGTL